MFESVLLRVHNNVWFFSPSTHKFAAAEWCVCTRLKNKIYVVVLLNQCFATVPAYARNNKTVINYN